MKKGEREGEGVKKGERDRHRINNDNYTTMT